MAKSPFTRILTIKIEQVQEGYYSILCLNKEGLILPPEMWISSLYYKHEESFYGSTVKTNERYIIVTSYELLDLLSVRYKNPFIEFNGADQTSVSIIDTIRRLQAYWLNDKIWSNITIDEESINPIKLDMPNLDKTDGEMLSIAIYQQLKANGLTVEDVKTLMPYFENGGWPLKSERQVNGPANIAFRLSEPTEDEDDWLLETVLISPNSANHWTPAVKKRQAMITEALPAKWRNMAADIEEIQQQMQLLLTIPNLYFEPTSFIHEYISEEGIRHFLQYDMAKLQALGYEIILPAWLKELKQSKMKVRVSANNTNVRKTTGLDDILTFKWQFSMNGQDISAEQFKKLVEEKRNYMQIGNEWFQIDANWLEEMRKLMAQAEEENWTVRDLIFKEIPESLTEPLEDEDEDRDDPLFAFEMQRSLEKFVEQLQLKKELPAVPVPQSLKAELRPYQIQGFEWLAFMREQRFGACLADDMGLGKTIQMITYILHTVEKLQVTEPSLVICPTSVLGNWQKELERFAPNLTVHTHYASNRLKDADFESYINNTKPNVILTTYGTVTQDVAFLQHHHFSSVVLDEAQNIKNMQTMQSRAIRKLKGDHHIALTGTPVENRLAELWAIFDFIHKGYLGSFSTFQEKFILPIEKDDSEQHKKVLRSKIQPFLLRRTKRDPELMLNLPEKLELQEFCPLTVEQAALYEGYIEDTLAQIEQLAGFEKKGRILKMLNKLKQLCNHPALYLKEPFTSAETMISRSIKLKRIVELVLEIVENGEQCLIFTQYIGMGELIQHCLSQLANIEAPFLTGSTTKLKRDLLVESFQEGAFPVFILSLKAGGTGLNLTAASHVLHADRWWNPAVENQATDRAYRIGQTSFVQVHKFTTIGTIEEKIDKMITMKSALSDDLIRSSKWITELNDTELNELLSLDKVLLK